MSRREQVTIEKRGPIAVVTLNRPEARNALDRATMSGLVEAFDRLDASPSLRVGVVTGAGGNFSWGTDRHTGDCSVSSLEGDLRALSAASSRKPLIAAVEGCALAEGFELVLSCDLVVAAEDARFGAPEVKRGAVPVGTARRLPERVPQAMALEILLTGEPVDALRAAKMGLVNKVTKSGRALQTALALAEVVAAVDPLTAETTKRIARGSGEARARQLRMDTRAPRGQAVHVGGPRAILRQSERGPWPR